MDMSKLPRLSQSPQPPPDASPEQSAPPPVQVPQSDYSLTRQPGTAAEIWISLAIGLILMFMGGRFGTYVISRVTHEPFHANVTWNPGTPREGQEVGYWDLDASLGFPAWTEASLWLFGLTMVVDAALLFFAGGKRLWLVGAAFTLTCAVCAFNAFVCAKCFSAGITPLMSMVALAFGIYMAIYQWGLLKEVSAAQALVRA